MNITIIIISSMLLVGFFSGIELAFLSANKFKIELENKQGKFTAKILSFFVKAPSKFICTVLVGLNIALVIYGTYMAHLLEPLIFEFVPGRYQSEVLTLIIETFISTLLILIAGEFLPKILFRINPNETLSFFSLPVFIFYFLFYPVVVLILGITHFGLRTLFKIDFTETRPLFGRIDLDHYLSNISTRNIQNSEINSEIEMFQAALDFSKIKIRNCMIPRMEIIAMNVEAPIQDLRNKFIETRLSRILIYRDAIENIIGFVHSYEMFKHPENIQSILLPVSIFPETMTAQGLLKHFTQEHRSVAVVVDEHGITSGMITVEDVIEEIFGEIQDEHDTEDLVENKISDHEYLFSGRLEIDYLNEKYNLKIPAGGYETLAGFIFYYHESIPEPTEVITIPPFVIKVQTLKGNRIEQVRFKIDRD
ncbi:MAG TPA: hemolysin family protein [Bacteroidia bacterium]|nr:hemolysin family protein [Bacteroidia bacterium]